MEFDPKLLAQIVQHLEAAYPEEGCGVVLERDGRVWVQALRNAYEDYRRADPSRFPRTARTAYAFDPQALIGLQKAEQDGTRIASIFHSHADAGAYFSAEDSSMAAPDGMPLFPGVTYLVVSVVGGKAREARAFNWDGTGFAGDRVAL